MKISCLVYTDNVYKNDFVHMTKLVGVLPINLQSGEEGCNSKKSYHTLKIMSSKADIRLLPYSFLLACC